MAVFTIGYPAAAAAVPADLRERELAPRTRKPLADERYDQGPV